MKRTNRGFTLVELMMVVLVISLLIFILIPAVTGVVKQVKIHQTQMLVNLLDLGCQQYKTAFGSYPPNSYGAPSTNNLDGWNWGIDTQPNAESPLILTYCLQGPAGMGWKMNRDGQLAGNPSASVTADFGPWVESGNQSIQVDAYYSSRPTFVDSFGTPIIYLAALMTYKGKPTRPNLVNPILNGDATQYYNNNSYYDRYNDSAAVGNPNFFALLSNGNNLVYPGTMGLVNNFGIQNLYPNGSGLPEMTLYAALMNQTYNPATNSWSGAPMTGTCYHPNSFVIWSAGSDRLFGFYYGDDALKGYVLDLSFNPANFDDITNFR